MILTRNILKTPLWSRERETGENGGWRNRQAGHDGPIMRKMNIPPPGETFILLVGEASPNPFEQLRTGAGCASLRDAFSLNKQDEISKIELTLFLIGL